MEHSGTHTDITEEDAKNQFLDFVDWIDEQKAASPDPESLPAVGYRMDTWQMWVKCEGHTPGDVMFPCQNPGLHIGIDAPDPEPFVGMIGPYGLFRERTVHDAFERISHEAAFHVIMASGHMHVFGQPHHFGCGLCREVPAEPFT
jgi:hypothetical protein